MWKRKLVWKNDQIEFTFQDQVVNLEESFQDDQMKFKATMKNGDQIKEVELRMTLKTVPEQKNNHPKIKAEKQEYFEQGSLLNPIKLEEDNNNELTDSQTQTVDSARALGENANILEKLTEKTQDDVTDVTKVSDPKEKRKRSALHAFKDATNVCDIVETDSSKKKPALDEAGLLSSVATVAENQDDKIILSSETKSTSDEDQTQGGRGDQVIQESEVFVRHIETDHDFTFKEACQSNSSKKVPPPCFKCCECDQSFGKNEVKYKAHKNMDHPWKCRFCHLKFTFSNGLEDHEKAEHFLEKRIEDRKSFKCNQCLKGFHRKGSYERHLNSSHVHPCDFCDLVFVNFHELETHVEEVGHLQKKHKGISSKFILQK